MEIIEVIDLSSGDEYQPKKKKQKSFKVLEIQLDSDSETDKQQLPDANDDDVIFCEDLSSVQIISKPVEKRPKQTMLQSWKLVKQIPVKGDIVLVMNKALKPWVKAKVEEIISLDPLQSSVELVAEKYHGLKKNVTGKELAVMSICSVTIPVATRVVARDSNSHNYYSGMIAEPRKSTNKERYLIFFDDGHAQYMVHENIFVVYENCIHVWEEFPRRSRDFIQKYLMAFPEGPMAKLSKGQVLEVERKGTWCFSQVVEVDSSLVQVRFDQDKCTEWIYRGSTRLEPFKETQEQEPKSLRPRRQRPISLPHVEYTSHRLEIEKHSKKELQKVAKKSFVDIPVSSEENGIKKQVEHICSPKCLGNKSLTVNDIKGVPPLSIPLLCGWNRKVYRVFKNKNMVEYQAPCGLQLKNMWKLHKFLQLTKSSMSVDLFEFNSEVNCSANPFQLEKYELYVKDLSSGVENVPISCVNDKDNTYPDKIKYSTRREPTEGVHINTDPEFLCGCDCVDDCQDKSKCACWKLNESSKNGYVFKRLLKPVRTGIYECNSRCKCAVKTCLNRVVQHPMTLQLQVFKTERTGWGIRCLHDIPQGSFICIYAGQLLTEQRANESATINGDEYYAELDYIEVVEDSKQGYESSVDEPTDVMSKTKETDMNMIVSANGMVKLVSCTEADDSENIETSEKNTILPDDMDCETRSLPDTQPMPLEVINLVDEIMLSDNEDTCTREPSGFDATVEPKTDDSEFKSVRKYFGENEVYIMDAKFQGNIGRYFNHSCDPNVFVQNVFVDTHDLRFPWVAFFAQENIPAGNELTWDYNYEIGSVSGKEIICHCGCVLCRRRLL